MSEFIDEEFDGVISSVTNSGLFVVLENTAEGRVSVADMRDDYYIFSATEYSLVGEHTGKVYRMGDSIKVIIDSVNTFSNRMIIMIRKTRFAGDIIPIISVSLYTISGNTDIMIITKDINIQNIEYSICILELRILLIT